MPLSSSSPLLGTNAPLDDNDDDDEEDEEDEEDDEDGEGDGDLALFLEMEAEAKRQARLSIIEAERKHNEEEEEKEKEEEEEEEGRHRAASPLFREEEGDATTTTPATADTDDGHDGNHSTLHVTSTAAQRAHMRWRLLKKGMLANQCDVDMDAVHAAAKHQPPVVVHPVLQVWLKLIGTVMAVEKSRARDIHNIFDGDNDGKLTREDVYGASQFFGLGFTPQEADALFDFLDTNKDGFIDVSEFSRHVRIVFVRSEFFSDCGAGDGAPVVLANELISQIASSSPTHASPNTSTHDLSERADGAVLRPGMSGGALDMPSPSVVRRRSRRSSSLRREQRHNSGGHGAGDSSQQQQEQEQGQKEEGEGKGAEEDGRGDGEGKARGGREGEGEEQLVGKEERHWNDSDTRSDAESEHVSLASQRQEDGDSDDGDAVQVQTHVNGNGALLHCDSSSGDAAGRQGDAHFTPLVSPTKGIVLEAPSPL